MSDDIKYMSVEEAEKIVAAGDMGPDFDEALKTLTEKAPNSDVLRAYNEKLNAQVKKTFDELMEGVNKDRNEREVLGQANNDLSDDKEVKTNINEIFSVMEDEKFKSYVSLATNRDAVHVNVDNNGTILGKTEGKDAATVAQEDALRKKFLNEMMEAAKHEVMMFYATDKKFAAYDKEQKRKILQDGVADVFNLKMAKAVAASAVKEATPEQSVPNTDSYKAYEEQSLADMRAALEAYYTKKPVSVKTKRIMESTVVTSQAMDEYEDGLKKKQLNESAQVFNQKKEDYNNKRRSFWGKAFDYAKKMWKGMKANRNHILTDAAVVASAGLVATISAPAAIGAAVGMGLYFSAGSFAWLLHDERKKMAAKSDDKSEWKGFNGMAKAYKNMDDEAKKNFWRQGSIQSIAGVAGAALFGAAATGAIFGAATNTAVAGGVAAKTAATNSATGVVAGRIANGVARSVGSVTNQGVNWKMADSKFNKDASEENKAALDEARTNFWVSAATALISNSVAAYFASAHSNVDTGSEAKLEGAEVKTEDVEVKTEGAEVKAEDAEVKTESDDVKTDGTEVKTETTPVEWQGHITEKQWNTLNRDVTGIYKDHAEIFGKENVAPEDAMKNMYHNIDNARAAGYFQGQSNEEVLYKYVQLIKQTERAEILKGTDYLVTKVGTDGQPMYWVNAEEMNALNKIIICNEEVDISADKIGNTLALINSKGAYTGEGANVGVTNNSYAGGRYDCDEYQNAWKRGAFAQKHPHHPAPKPAEPETPAKVDETTVDNAKTEQPKVDETTVNKPKSGKTITWEERKYTTGDNTVGSGTGKHAEKVIKSGVADAQQAYNTMRSRGLVNS